MNKKLVILLITFSIKGLSLLGQNTYDVFLFLGQSNMAGRAPIENQDMGILNHVFLFNDQGSFEPAQNLSIDPNANGGMNGMNRYSPIRKTNASQLLSPAFEFGKTLASYNTNPLGLIVHAKGGTSIDTWQPSEENYQTAVARVKQAIDNNPGSKLKAILWLGGETDRDNTSTFTAKFNTMVTSLRSDLANYYDTELPIIVNELAKFNADLRDINIIIHKLPLHVENIYINSSSGLKKVQRDFPADVFHFDPYSIRKIGRRFATRYTEIKKRTFTGTTTWTGQNNSALNVVGTALLTSYIPPANQPNLTNGMYHYNIKQGKEDQSLGGIKATVPVTVSVPGEQNNFIGSSIDPLINNPNINGVSLSVYRYFPPQVGGTRKGHLLYGVYSNNTHSGNHVFKSWGSNDIPELQDYDDNSENHKTNAVNNLELYNYTDNIESFKEIPVIIEVFIRNATLESINIPGIGILTPADIINSNGSILHMIQEEEIALLQAKPAVNNINHIQSLDYNKLLITEPSIYPNPSTGDFQVKWNLPNAVQKNIHITVFDAQGKMIIDYPNLDLGLGTQTISINDFQHKCNCKSGVFFVKFKHNNTIITKKLIIQ